MDKKEIVSNLVKVANVLDTMGLEQESKIVDKVMRKVADYGWSSDEKTKLQQEYQYYIQQYKKMMTYVKKQNDAFDLEAQRIFNEFMKMHSYSTPEGKTQAGAFRDQAERIRKETGYYQKIQANKAPVVQPQ